MAPFSVQEITTRDLLDSVVDLIWEGQYKPYMPHVAMYYPVDGYSSEAFDKAIARSKERIWNEFKQLSTDDRWICVIDDATLKPVGCALWHKLSGSPAPDGCPKLDFYWLPDGPIKAFSEEMFQQIRVPRCLWMNRRHGDLSNMVVHPSYRGMGIGGLLMDWGNNFLDEEGLEGLIEANAVGRQLYEKCGYKTVMRISTYVPITETQSFIQSKIAYEYKLPDDMGYILWRPQYGIIKPNYRSKPWQ